MALNVTGNAKIKEVEATRKDGTAYKKYVITIVTTDKEDKPLFQDLNVLLTKNVNKELISEVVKIDSAWLQTNSKDLTLVVNKVSKVEGKKAE